MTIKAEVIAHSIADGCPPLITVRAKYPRLIHPEMLTHRDFSRNAGSSRATPFETMVNLIKADPAMPVHWGAEQSGMQAGDEIADTEDAKHRWLAALDDALWHAKLMHDLGVHKQVVNRMIEPFMHIDVLITSTNFDNFFALRAHEDAQPEIQAVAIAMRDAIEDSTPQDVSDNKGWHTPFVDLNKPNLSINDGLNISTACCASVSFMTVDGKLMTLDRATKIYNKLAGSDPIHASPFEHVAHPSPEGGPGCRNFTKWTQRRHYIEA